MKNRSRVWGWARPGRNNKYLHEVSSCSRQVERKCVRVCVRVCARVCVREGMEESRIYGKDAWCCKITDPRVGGKRSEGARRGARRSNGLKGATRPCSLSPGAGGRKVAADSRGSLTLVNDPSSGIVAQSR
jgi:hypothetical protein